jgi:predicted lipoprotein with Yx(FWY)xxD motif
VLQSHLRRGPRRAVRGSLVLVLATAAVAVVIAGCGGSSSSGGAAVKSGASAKPGGAMVSARKTSLGTILVDAQGRTLYLFEKDKRDASMCDGSCASIWPSLTSAAKPLAGHGVVAGKLATAKRGDGHLQVTYAGHPLYTYAGDAKPGDATGQGLDQFGAEWYVLTPRGRKVDNG